MIVGEGKKGRRRGKGSVQRYWVKTSKGSGRGKGNVKVGAWGGRKEGWTDVRKRSKKM